MQQSGKDEDSRDDDDEHGVRTGPRVLRRLHDDADRDGEHEDRVHRAHVAGNRHLPVRLAPSHAAAAHRRTRTSTHTYRYYSYTSRHGLILIHRFPLSLLLFHNHRSLSFSIRGNHLYLLYLGFLTLPFLPPFSPPPFPCFRAPAVLPFLSPLLLYTSRPIICPHSCTIYSYTGFATRDDAYDVMLGLHHNTEL